MLVIKKIVNKIKVKMLNINFIRRVKKAFSRKTPKDYKYPYYLINPIELFSNYKLLDQLYFVGENWFKNKDLPIAVLWGFNDWKLGFSSDYLPEYRTVFVPRKKNSLVANLAISKLIKNCPDSEFVNIIWGYNENRFVNFFIKCRNQPIYRMEDGFLRSAELGASHSTPYSLVLDKTGIYYNQRKNSDIENILNNFDFKNNENIVNHAHVVMDRLMSMELSKYNPPQPNNDNLIRKIKIRKRILVLGQVDGDAAIKYGNPGNWDSESLVKLAKLENPNADVYYRPHPDVYWGYQNSKFKKNKIESFATLLSPEEPFIETIKSVDHIYTITSLSGLEALIRGKKVTVLGYPFYAGWGLTDDRVEIKRSRKLKLEELVAAVYLIYPRYLASIENSFEGFLATCYRIKSEKFLLTSDLERNRVKNGLNDVMAGDVLKEFILSSKASSLEKFNVNIGDIGKYVNVKGGGVSLIFSSVLIKKIMDNNQDLNFVFSDIQARLHTEDYNNLLLWLHQSTGLDVSSHLIKLIDSNFLRSDTESVIDRVYTMIDDDNRGIMVPKESIDEIKTKFDHAYVYSDLDRVLEFSCKLAFNGILSPKDIYSYLDLIERKFKFDEAFFLSDLLTRFDIRAFNKRAVFTLNSIYSYVEDLDKERYFSNSCLLSVLKPETYEITTRRISELDSYSNSNYSSLLEGVFSLGYSYSYNYINFLIEAGRLDKAEYIFSTGFRHVGLDDKYIVVYSRLLVSQGKFYEAYSYIKSIFERSYSLPIAREYIRLSCICGEFESALNVYEIIECKGDYISPLIMIPVYQSLNRIQKAYEMYRLADSRKSISSYFDVRSCVNHTISKNESFYLLSAYGPGDEIRFSTLYMEIHKDYPYAKITCESRLYNLMSRTYPEIEFIPVKRIRNISRYVDCSDYNCLPDMSLTSLMDNSLYSDLIKSNEKIRIVTDFISDYRYDISSFTKPKKFVLNESLVHSFKVRLSKYNDFYLVGINWRSSLNGGNRNVHYLSVDDLEPLFKLDNVVFVNLQYDNCIDEINQIRDKTNCDIINFDDIDQYNDFDSVAALMKNLDLVIAPCTSVAELAGAVDVKTILFSNTAELKWRKKHDGRDIWFPSIFHISPEEYGDKSDLVNKICNKVGEFSIIKEDSIYFKKKNMTESLVVS
ncbi:capsular polysaccharide export protein, LipB/KpsS family [Vibrio metschnikovii]|uniref:capsular polysaccharide export protein, LipB/KpsS family n=1 Tax=Vibrio metschnikovii TaxID=28172 RepID=UPI001C30E48B|nr:hypothetical protein [Vibrio metschnikovii]